jgi:hypothetical protein
MLSVKAEENAPPLDRGAVIYDNCLRPFANAHHPIGGRLALQLDHETRMDGKRFDPKPGSILRAVAYGFFGFWALWVANVVAGSILVAGPIELANFLAIPGALLTWLTIVCATSMWCYEVAPRPKGLILIAIMATNAGIYYYLMHGLAIGTSNSIEQNTWLQTHFPFSQGITIFGTSFHAEYVLATPLLLGSIALGRAFQSHQQARLERTERQRQTVLQLAQIGCYGLGGALLSYAYLAFFLTSIAVLFGGWENGAAVTLFIVLKLIAAGADIVAGSSIWRTGSRIAYALWPQKKDRPDILLLRPFVDDYSQILPAPPPTAERRRTFFSWLLPLGLLIIRSQFRGLVEIFDWVCAGCIACGGLFLLRNIARSIDPSRRLLFHVLKSSTHASFAAVGNFQEMLPQFFLDWRYFSHEDWEVAVVQDLMRHAKLIVVIPGATAGIQKEISEVFNKGWITKTLFIIPPPLNMNKKEDTELRAMFRSNIERRLEAVGVAGGNFETGISFGPDIVGFMCDASRKIRHVFRGGSQTAFPSQEHSRYLAPNESDYRRAMNDAWDIVHR